MEQSAADVLVSMNIAEAKYQEVIVKFDEFFGIRRNIILERAKFNSRNQGADESAEAYITALYSLIETCGYKPDTVNEMLRDRLVVALRAAATRPRANGGASQEAKRGHERTEPTTPRPR